MGLSDTSNTHLRYLSLRSVQGHFGSFGALVTTCPVARKGELVVERGENIWDTGTLVTLMHGTFDLVLFTIILWYLMSQNGGLP